MLPFKKIFCPTDFSKRSIAAVEAASELATHFSSELCILHIVSPDPIVPLGPEPVPLVGPGPWEAVPLLEPDASLPEPEPSAKEPVDEVIKKLAAKGLKVHLIAVPGKAPEEISNIAREEQADLIVMTTHGYTGLEHLIFGSVAEKVTRVAPCPVLIVRRPEEGEEEQEKSESERTDKNQSDDKGLREAISDQLEELGARINTLKADLLGPKSDLKTRYDKQAENLKVKAEEIQKKMEQLKETGGEAWEELKVGLAELWNSFDRAFSKFQEKQEETLENLTERKKSYERRIEEELQELRTKIDVLKAKAEASKEDVRNVYIQQIEDLHAKHEGVSKKLDRLKESGEDAWEDVKKGVDTALSDLGKALKDAISRFQ